MSLCVPGPDLVFLTENLLYNPRPSCVLLFSPLPPCCLSSLSSESHTVTSNWLMLQRPRSCRVGAGLRGSGPQGARGLGLASRQRADKEEVCRDVSIRNMISFLAWGMVWMTLHSGVCLSGKLWLYVGLNVLNYNHTNGWVRTCSVVISINGKSSFFVYLLNATDWSKLYSATECGHEQIVKGKMVTIQRQLPRTQFTLLIWCWTCFQPLI